MHPLTGRVHIVTKGDPGGVYALPATPSRQGVNRLERLGPAPARATDAVFLADGSSLAVRTYTQLVLLDGTTFLQQASARLPLQPQGETLALAPGGDGLLAGSEGRRSAVQQVAVPERRTPTSTPPPAPDPRPHVTLLETPLDFSHLRAEPSPAERAGELLAGPAGLAVVGSLLAALALVVRQSVRRRRRH